MSDYLVTFKAYLDPTKKPEDWPNPITNVCAIRSDTFENFRKLVNDEMKKIISFGGFAVLKETKKPLRDDTETLDLVRFVPMHMILCIERETKKMSAEMPDESDEGVLRQ